MECTHSPWQRRNLRLPVHTVCTSNVVHHRPRDDFEYFAPPRALSSVRATRGTRTFPQIQRYARVETREKRRRSEAFRSVAEIRELAREIEKVKRGWTQCSRFLWPLVFPFFHPFARLRVKNETKRDCSLCFLTFLFRVVCPVVCLCFSLFFPPFFSVSLFVIFSVSKR